MSVYAYTADTGVNLTQLYNDAKKSAPPREIEDNASSALADLHTEFAFQQKRLDSWGVQWSDEGKGPDGNIDATLAREGFTGIATQVLEEILSLNKEAAQIRASDGSRTQAWAAGGPEKRPSIPTIDMSRYTDLIQTLTKQIDTLFDISRSRRVHIAGSAPTFESGSAAASGPGPGSSRSVRGEENDAKSVRFTAFEPTVYDSRKFSTSRRLGTPHAIDPSALLLPPEGPPPYQNAGVALTTRMIGRLFRSQVPEPVRLSLQEFFDDPLVLVEYVNFDPIFADSNALPPLAKLGAYASYLQQMSSQPQLNLLGYFQEPNSPRIGLIYDISDCFSDPGASEQQDFENVEQHSLLHLLQAASKNAKNSDTLAVTPALEDRFKLAYRVAEHMEYMHQSNFTHGNLSSDAILFVTDDVRQDQSSRIQTPVMGSFDLLSSSLSQGYADESGSNIYQHPDSEEPADDLTSRMKRDIYGLGLILLEIGLWTPLSDLHKAKYQLHDFKTRLERIWIPRLAIKCGSAYMNTVKACFEFSDDLGSSSMLVARHYGDVLDKLQRCCLICDDDDSFLTRWSSRQSYAPSDVDSGYHTLRSEWGHGRQHSVSSARSRLSSRPSRSPSTRPRHRSVETLTTLFNDGFSFRDIRDSAITIQRRWRRWKNAKIHGEQHSSRALDARPKTSATAQLPPKDLHASSPKQRVFPCRLAPEQLAEWHSTLALRISHIVERALKGSRESSTIELINVGTDEESSKPTIIVTCSSTALVKAAIKRRFRCDNSVYNIKVRKDTVSASRAAVTPRYHATNHERVARSFAGYDSDELEVEARNPGWFERPTCGSSIGAYHEDLGHQDSCTFGGIVLVDDQPFGMSVHHMLGSGDHEEDSIDMERDDDEGSIADDESVPELLPVAPKVPYHPPARRSSAHPSSSRAATAPLSPIARASPPPSDSASDVEPAALSDTDIEGGASSGSDVALLSASESDLSDSDVSLPPSPASRPSPPPLFPPQTGPIISPGDTRGYHPSSSRTAAWRITQPSLDDALDQDLHELDQDQLEIDDDHLREYMLGTLHASSGLHRAADHAGFAQEMDWALFSVQPARLPGANLVRGARAWCDIHSPNADVCPARVARLADVPGASVFAAGRTSGLARGRVHAARVRMKIEGRESFCWSWMVVPEGEPALGVAGDSGAWIVDGRGQVVGVVLAHAARSRVTYFCPMELIMEDVRRCLSTPVKTVKVALPGLLEKREVSPPEPRRRPSYVVRSRVPVTVTPNLPMRSPAGGVRWRADAVPT